MVNHLGQTVPIWLECLLALLFFVGGPYFALQTYWNVQRIYLTAETVYASPEEGLRTIITDFNDGRLAMIDIVSSTGVSPFGQDLKLIEGEMSVGDWEETENPQFYFLRFGGGWVRVNEDQIPLVIALVNAVFGTNP